ncbi:hypothetical protein KPL70_025919 [Citrus sinensis]|nr:hypothetical protein KPL70_025919 [Citrus sinensis]GAY53233.1 hypothetical protein CUMW_147790 [Citrus unshiu]
MSGKLDFPQLSEVNNSGVRVSVRKSLGHGQPSGIVVSAATSLWLPLPSHNVFNFFKDEKMGAVYAPIDIPSMNLAISGDDSSNIPILPSGTGIGTSGSLLTVAFQILVSSPSLSKELNMESVATVNTLISSTFRG